MHFYVLSCLNFTKFFLSVLSRIGQFFFSEFASSILKDGEPIYGRGHTAAHQKQFKGKKQGHLYHPVAPFAPTTASGEAQKATSQ